MPKGGRSMTTEEKNKILELRKSGKSIREICEIVDRSNDTVHSLVNSNVDHFSKCPVCGFEIAVLKGPGRKRVYCSDECRRSKKNRKVEERVCLNCGKHFVTWKYKRIKYCCHSCYVEYRYGKRLQDKSP